ncbi:MAG: DNA cytosine methyltransferase [Lysobacter sp.]
MDFDLIAPGEVDERSIAEVQPEDLEGFSQAHFFAGIGGWSLAARIAGWPDDEQLWSGSCPCQPFSAAGKTLAQLDERHLWPHFFRLIRARRPERVVGEQVAAAIGLDWLDGVFDDLEGEGYACGAAVLPATAVGAPHQRDRLWFMADADSTGLQGLGEERQLRKDREEKQARRQGGFHTWGGQFQRGHDGRHRRIAPGVPCLAHGVPARVERTVAFGNAIVPQVAAEFLAAVWACRP